MSGLQDTTAAVQTLLRRDRVVELGVLFEVLETRSRMTVFRRLKGLGYQSGFSHGGKYYTLAEVPAFDEKGLWFHEGIGFSRAGTLKQTVVVQVDAAQEGLTHAELRLLLRVRVHNTLLELVRQGCLGRAPFGRVHLYVSADAERAAAQVARRQERAELLAEGLKGPTVEETVEILIESLRAAPEVPKPAVVARRLVARGVQVETRHVEQVFEANGLSPGKKTAPSGSRRSRS